ncbi:MAG: hypothetical protein LBJ74_04200 [Heliobacteriaceae bacterium]|jgi:hypothetical protein|nr:hypothetical protein [Heliobacteriaceae bacterium]
MKPPNNAWNGLKDWLYKNYGEHPGKMFLHTGTVAWIFSALGQLTAIVFNDKISSDQKAFLIPQELSDAAINILSFYIVTSSVTKLASKLVSTGKVTTKPIREYLEKCGLKDKIGKLDFNIPNALGDKFSEIKKDHYKPFKNGVDIAASTAGSVLSCNIITPLIRNSYAADRQQYVLAQKRRQNQQNMYAPGSLDDYQKLAAM